MVTEYLKSIHKHLHIYMHTYIFTYIYTCNMSYWRNLDVSKFRPNSLLNTWGKVLEIVVINRINNLPYSHDFFKQKPVCIHTSNEHHRCGNGSDGLRRRRPSSRRTGKCGCKRCLWCCLVTQHFKRIEILWMPQKSEQPS